MKHSLRWALLAVLLFTGYAHADEPDPIDTELASIKKEWDSMSADIRKTQQHLQELQGKAQQLSGAYAALTKVQKAGDTV